MERYIHNVYLCDKNGFIFEIDIREWPDLHILIQSLDIPALMRQQEPERASFQECNAMIWRQDLLFIRFTDGVVHIDWRQNHLWKDCVERILIAYNVDVGRLS